MRGLLQRFRAGRHAPPVDAVLPAATHEQTQPAARGVDAISRHYWAPGASAPATLVEARGSARETDAGRVAALVRAHEQGRDRRTGRPAGNPAFSEALFVELMRARQYRRAFDLLSDDCRRRWGSADAFAAAQGSALRRLRGVRVTEIRYLTEWTDSQAGRRYEDVAELDVEYTFDGRDDAAVVRRVVHLVPDEGKWRSLCYPV